MSDWKRLVDVVCPSCGYTRKAQLRNRGLIRECSSCLISKRKRSDDWCVTHGQSKTPLYRVWNAMKQRCDTPTSDVYVDYGGRGITYCPEWSEFVPFSNWALANGYARGLLLDRVDNNGNYEPSNCRWATPHQSAINRRTTKINLDDVAVMKSLYEMGVRVGLVAALYGITVDRLADIREGKTWKNNLV